MKKTYVALAFSALALCSADLAHAADRHPVAIIKNYTCMMLNLTHEQEMDFQHPVMILSEPREGAANIGGASDQVAIPTGAQPTNGYLPVLQTNFEKGWIKASLIAPYASKSDPTARCIPVRMSDGIQGFTYRHGK